MKFLFNDITITTAQFQSPTNGAEECHAILSCPSDKRFPQQLESLLEAIRTLNDGRYGSCLFIRFFLSDASNQTLPLQEKLAEIGLAATISIIQQPPLDGSKIAAWCYFCTEMKSNVIGSHRLFSHNGYDHTWSANRMGEGSSYDQTFALLEAENEKAKELGMNFADHCIRTWFYVQNIDVNYMGMVKARKLLFETYGLTHCTHYIASTGIEGRSDNPSTSVRLDSYLVKGLKQEQIQYLYALSHLNPTYEYGVTFERATAVHYGDRKHIFLSGTASIDNKGDILHLGDIEKQTLRMWENSEALLQEAGATLDNMVHLFVYLRDTADYGIVKQLFDERFPNTPKIILLAPVCRPGWLIEMEGIACVENNEPQYPNF